MVWAVLLAALTWVSVRDDPPTVREQRSLDQAGPVVDRAVGELVAAAGDAVLALTPARVERGCRVTPFADGATLARGVDVVVPAGEERALLERVADRLPAGWGAGVRATPDGPRLRADAGEFVTVEGRAGTDGRVRLTADTGCRPVGSGYATPPPGAAGAELSVLAEALAALGRPAGPDPEVLAAPCPGGGVARTARVAGGAPPLSPAAALARFATPVADTPEVYAYRRGDVAVLVDRAAGDSPVSATTACPR
ncbi:hypothetical protein [Micromonospora sp. C28SCA-DRY-2]|uniref:hypothetical protein n=1 Tax=Micromonospora sp. C28SCA-DRY-2 TaxID=3059522 RepID=UPI00349FD702